MSDFNMFALFVFILRGLESKTEEILLWNSHSYICDKGVFNNAPVAKNTAIK